METVTQHDALDDLTAAIDLCDGLVGDCDTHLLWLANNPQKVPERRNAIRLLNENPKLQDELRVLFDILRPDIVHTHRMDELATVGQAARHAGVPNIVHSVCGTITGAEKGQLDEYAAAMEKLSPLLIAPSAEAAERLPSSGRIEILPAGIDCERYVPGDQVRERRKIGLPSEPRMIGCASPLHGFGALLHALFRTDREVHLALFGQARPGQAERGLIKRLGLEERVHVLGAWAKPELVYQAIDVYFHGPSDDCLPRAVLAAQACGKPAIACAPTPSTMLCPQTGRLTPIQYMPTLLHSLRRALESTKPEVTRQFILDNWNADQSLEGYSALFRQLANRNQPKRLPA
jgi:glycosyltransferase involved in cell wall biosynthesis